MRRGEALLPGARAAAGPVGQADARLSCWRAEDALGNREGVRAEDTVPCSPPKPNRTWVMDVYTTRRRKSDHRAIISRSRANKDLPFPS